MPWKLENKNKNIVKYFLPSVTYTIGRVSADVILTHTSISRKHAVLIWECDLNYITIDDCSKFGTFINKAPLINKKGNIKDGDIVTFGAQPGVDLNCSFVAFDIVCSTLSNADRVLLKQYLSIIGGNLLENCNDKVEYMVMSNLKATFKVVCALIKQIKIVKIDFVKAMVDYFKGINQILPDPDHYLPEIHNPDDCFIGLDYKPNPKRKCLFNNKQFYFLTQEKLSLLSEAVLSGGGIAMLLTDSDCRDQSLRVKLAHCDSIVMQEAVTTNLVNEISLILKGINKRLINDSEIGFAVMLASVDEYCNPYRALPKSHDKENNNPKQNPFPSLDKLPCKEEPSTNHPNKQVHNNSLGELRAHDINAIDFDRDRDQIITISDTDSESDTNSNAHQHSLRRNQENNSPKPNLSVSKFFNLSTTNLPTMKRKFAMHSHDEFNNDFDNISIPGLQRIPANTLILESTSRTIFSNFQDEEQNAHNIFPKKRKMNNTTDRSVSSCKIQNMSQTTKLVTDKQLFDLQLIREIPTRIQINPANEMDIRSCTENVKFAQLIKEKYIECKNYKMFIKSSPIYIERNSVPLVQFR